MLGHFVKITSLKVDCCLSFAEFRRATFVAHRRVTFVAHRRATFVVQFLCESALGNPCLYFPMSSYHRVSSHRFGLPHVVYVPGVDSRSSFLLVSHLWLGVRPVYFRWPVAAPCRFVIRWPVAASCTSIRWWPVAASIPGLL